MTDNLPIPIHQRRKQRRAEIISEMLADSNEKRSELYALWLEITDALIERHEWTPDELAEGIREDYGDGA